MTEHASTPQDPRDPADHIDSADHHDALEPDRQAKTIPESAPFASVHPRPLGRFELEEGVTYIIQDPRRTAETRAQIERFDRLLTGASLLDMKDAIHGTLHPNWIPGPRDAIAPELLGGGGAPTPTAAPSRKTESRVAPEEPTAPALARGLQMLRDAAPGDYIRADELGDGERSPYPPATKLMRKRAQSNGRNIVTRLRRLGHRIKKAPRGEVGYCLHARCATSATAATVALTD